jgi:hypothetical protein
MQAVQRIGQPRVVKGIRTLFQRAEGDAGLLPFAVRISDWPSVLHSSGRSPTVLICWRSTFQLFRIIGSARDRHHQAVIILLLQTIDNNLLRGIMIVALDERLAIATCRDTWLRVLRLWFSTSRVIHRCRHRPAFDPSANPRQLFQRGAVLFIMTLAFAIDGMMSSSEFQRRCGCRPARPGARLPDDAG